MLETRRKLHGANIGLNTALKVYFYTLSSDYSYLFILSGLEKLLQSTAGKYCIGDEVPSLSKNCSLIYIYIYIYIYISLSLGDAVGDDG